MDFRDYYRRLDSAERQAFAERAETSVNYIEQHLLPRRKTPRRPLLERLAKATQGEISYAEMVNYYYGQPETAA